MNAEREAAAVARALEPVAAREAIKSERRAAARERQKWQALASRRPGRVGRARLVDARDVDEEVLKCFTAQERGT